MKTTESLALFSVKNNNFNPKEVEVAKQQIEKYGDLVWLDPIFKKQYVQFVNDEKLSKINTKIVTSTIYGDTKCENLKDFPIFKERPFTLLIIILSAPDKWVEGFFKTDCYKWLVNIEQDQIVNLFRTLNREGTSFDDVISEQKSSNLKEPYKLTKRIVFCRIMRIIFALFSEDLFKQNAKKLFTELEKTGWDIKVLGELGLAKEFYDSLAKNNYTELFLAVLKKNNVENINTMEYFESIKYVDKDFFKNSLNQISLKEFHTKNKLHVVKYMNKDILKEKLLNEIDIDILNFVLDNDYLKMEAIPVHILKEYEDLSEKIYAYIYKGIAPVKLSSDFSESKSKKATEKLTVDGLFE